MKRLTTYISHMKDHHSLNEYLNEKLVVNKNYKNAYTYSPESFDELKEIIDDQYDKLGPGTEQKPINFNDIDVSNIDSFYDGDIGIFEGTKFEYIDVSSWNVSNVENMNSVFLNCRQLKSVGDLSEWNVSKVKDMHFMFGDCIQLNSVGDLSNWDVSNVDNMNSTFYKCEELTSVGDVSNWKVHKVKDMAWMFNGCEKLESLGDLSKWKVSKVKDMYGMFEYCQKLVSVGDLSNWNVSKVKDMRSMFDCSGIRNIPDWYKE